MLFFAAVAIIALGLRARERPVAAGVFAFVAVLLFGTMVGAFWTWFGWLEESDNDFEGFNVARLSLVLLTLIAAVAATRVFRAPFLALLVSGLSWIFITDLVSGGGDWSAVVTLLVGLGLLATGLVLDSGESRPYGFWVHIVAGLTISGALLYWWSDSDVDWALMIVVSLIFVAIGSELRRGSYAVIGAILVAGATSHYADQDIVYIADRDGSAAWVSPVAFLCLGFFLALVGLLLARRRREPDTV